MNRVKEEISRFIATAAYTGYFPFAPGTIGSLVCVVGLFFLGRNWPALTSDTLFWLIGIGLIIISIITSHKAAPLFKKGDPGPIVIDEIAGQWITFLFVPLTIRTLILGFLLFRCFDIIKPTPINALEESEGGVGITMDDIGAGVAANCSLIGILYLYNSISNYL